ncbi:MAG: histidinol-phosphate transaminase [Oscillospiraceae bacterium]|nr:histidinol-phosphate transaminase [Oscillospiraceae bacterium]MBQ5712030.1 histidinol-phosphate transaminase [Oscillospiraceae bacterium]
MSRFFDPKLSALTPYTPGEQPKDRLLLKLNTNESPFPPSPLAQRYAREEAGRLELYSDPCCTALVKKGAEVFGVEEDEIIFTNGSDEVLDFTFQAFCPKGAIFPDITYGFYKVFAALHQIPFTEVPLKEDFTIDLQDYLGTSGTVFIANPNAPTGLYLTPAQVETIVSSDPDRLVVIDEAYIDFGGETSIPLTKKYDNLLVIGTFSKSRSMAGARLGFAIGNKALIRCLNTIKYSFNPYNVDRMAMAAGVGALEDKDYFRTNCEKIMATRAWTTEALEKLGFTVLPSLTNFVFAKHDRIPGKTLCAKLREQGILVRHFDTPRLTDYLRITIGSQEQMEAFAGAITNILEG